MPTQRRVHLGLARTYQILTLFPPRRLVHNVVLALLGLDKLRWNPWTCSDRPSPSLSTPRARRSRRSASATAPSARGGDVLRRAAPARDRHGAGAEAEGAAARRAARRPVAGASAAGARAARQDPARRHHRDDRARHGHRARLRRAHHAPALRRGDRRRHARRGGGRPAHREVYLGH